MKMLSLVISFVVILVVSQVAEGQVSNQAPIYTSVTPFFAGSTITNIGAATDGSHSCDNPAIASGASGINPNYNGFSFFFANPVLTQIDHIKFTMTNTAGIEIIIIEGLRNGEPVDSSLYTSPPEDGGTREVVSEDPLRIRVQGARRTQGNPIFKGESVDQIIMET